MTDPHARTDKLFGQLIEKARDDDVRLLLQGMAWLGTLIEQVSLGIQDEGSELHGQLSHMQDQLDEIKAALEDR